MAGSVDVLVFGGTTEGRVLAERLAARAGVQVTACTATDYGACLLEERPNLRVVAHRLDEAAMERLMRARPFVCAVDATHPYAVEVSENAAAAARACGLPLLRVVREGEPEGPWTGASSAADAAATAAAHAGNVLLTTGSNDLPVYVRAMPDFRDRLYVRILPALASLERAVGLGVPGKHIIAMQGPFSYELNCALIRDLDIACMVTKASGRAGGFPEKVRAAQDCGVELVVVHRPVNETGLSLEEACERLGQIIDAAQVGTVRAEGGEMPNDSVCTSGASSGEESVR